MPLQSGSSPSTISANIGELMRTYKGKKKIGNTRPKSKKHAQKIAAAIAYDKARRTPKPPEPRSVRIVTGR